jgi:N-succinyldiaminopimelate aminotransferase
MAHDDLDVLPRRPDLTEVVGDGTLPNHYGDSELLARYERLGGDLDALIYLSLGETWTRAAPALVAELAHVPSHSHGYVLTPYGLPALQQVLRTYVGQDHRLGAFAPGEDYEVAVAQNSTRSPMFDFGRLLLEDADGGDPVLFFPHPGWDYPGVFGGLGYRMHHYAVTAERGWEPDVAAVREALSSVPGSPKLLVLNPQHNPTGANWSEATVRGLVRAAVETGAAVLLDDAFYGMVDPQVTATSGLRIVLEEMTTCSGRWLAVRSLGKQFHCNGWGIGAVTGHPDTMRRMATHFLHHHAFVSAVPLQAAMAAWLGSPQSRAYLAESTARYAAARRHIAERLRADLGQPLDFVGDCTPYLRLRVPPAYERCGDAEQRYRWDGTRRAGVLLGAGGMYDPGDSGREPHAHVRFYLGHPRPLLDEAVDRLAAAGLGWAAQPS